MNIPKLNKFNKFMIGFILTLSIVTSLLYFSVSKSCEGVCSIDYNQVMNNKGYKPMFDREIVSGKEQANVWVIDFKSAYNTASAEKFAEEIDYVFAHRKIGDILHVNILSPGGATTACGLNYDMMIQASEKLNMNTVVSVDYLAASCGYQLASAADEIYAASGSAIGNIGAVYHRQATIMDMANKKSGTRNTYYGSTRIKELLVGAPVETKEDVKFFKDKAIAGSIDFAKRVLYKRSDKIKKEDYDRVFSADIFTGLEAKELGLIDGIKDFRLMMREYHIKGHKITMVVTVVKKGFIEGIVSSSFKSAFESFSGVTGFNNETIFKMN